ncbi:MAG: alpha mannosidase-like protein [Cirrosporium novae-zelandiae]|nr:MAG: alpha mannosidase-like protein [Cirrosporium novae-zelandiae]
MRTRQLRPALALHSQAQGSSLLNWVCLLLLIPWLKLAFGMTDREIWDLRKETVEVFYHGYDNYMKYAFPDDELRPITCKPLTRDRQNPAHIELNDVLGNYSLTLVDTLSTLAILASSSENKLWKHKPLEDFQKGVATLVKQYGDGTDGPNGVGIRAKGFDLDSKVQVFETVIRGVGGLLSAHLFAVGDLPIRGYEPSAQEIQEAKFWTEGSKNTGIKWKNGFRYNGQLLRLAHDLGKRLLPAFYSATGIPYPRVNLRYGIPFYPNSPLNYDPDGSQYLSSQHGSLETTETCSAGAGSLLLEFITLSRLTGDDRFEALAKRAFWAIWDKRSSVGLLGAGIDAESGSWIGPITGIGAGIDSFFEYAFKTYVLLAGLEPKTNSSLNQSTDPFYDPNVLFEPLTLEENSPNAFLRVWNNAHAAIKRHVYRGSDYEHPHYIQVELFTGSPRAYWIDSLSAYYPGLLTIAGELNEAIEAHLLTTALWTRYSALPERWSAYTRDIEGGLGWWGGRPEFIESNYYLFRATKDPWYLHVGEMALRDIKRRSWTRCGLAGLHDVRNGEKSDRMESFFLSETAQYLFLLFDSSHPLNILDKPFVFSTEGHPLLIPKLPAHEAKSYQTKEADVGTESSASCPLPPGNVPLSFSATAARADVFHASALARLNLIPDHHDLESSLLDFSSDYPSISVSDIRSPSNFTYYPWTLPPQLMPANGMSAAMPIRSTLDISFPALPNMLLGPGTLTRVRDGIQINSLGGLKFQMIRDVPGENRLWLGEDDQNDDYRIYILNNVLLGKDEKIYLARDVVPNVISSVDPNFERVRDNIILEIVIDVRPSYLEDDAINQETLKPSSKDPSISSDEVAVNETNTQLNVEEEGVSSVSPPKITMSSLIQQVLGMLREPDRNPHKRQTRYHIPAMSSSGLGAAPLPDFPEAPSVDASGASYGPLSWRSIYIAGEACSSKLPISAPKNHQIIVLKRGGCSFSHKLQNIPSFAPSLTSLQLVIVVSDEEFLLRPHLDEAQHTPAGLARHNAIPMVMVGGGDETYSLFKNAAGVGVKRRYEYRSQGVPISNLIIT